MKPRYFSDRAAGEVVSTWRVEMVRHLLTQMSLARLGTLAAHATEEGPSSPALNLNFHDVTGPTRIRVGRWYTEDEILETEGIHGDDAAYIAAADPASVLGLVRVAMAAAKVAQVRGLQFEPGAYSLTRSPDENGNRSRHSRWTHALHGALYELEAALRQMDGRS